LARQIGARAAVFVPEAKTESAWSAAELSMAYARELSGVEMITSLRDGANLRAAVGDKRLVVLDRRVTPREELAFWERLGPVLALDEGGEARQSAHYLLDILPRLARGAGTGPANLSGLRFLDLPRNRRAPSRDFRRVLLSFGGEDPAGLSIGLARALIVNGFFAPQDLTFVSGALRRGALPPELEGVTVLGPVQDLKEHLASYDLVFTQFGLTAFEAAWAGCAVVLLNPSRYHRELSRVAGFPEIGIGKPEAGILKRLLSSPAALIARTAGLAPAGTESLAGLIASLAPAGPTDCPICGSPERRAVHRDASKSLFRCADCGELFGMRFSPDREDPYTESYFFEEYRRQYGRTYLEDWPNLTRLASSRLDIVEELAERSLGRRAGLSMLDVGCAYGPFLSEARERGQEPYGLDASPEAAGYVRAQLGIPAVSGDFLDPATAAAFGGPFDVLSMWYVVEHFDDLDRALRMAASLVRPGGIFALSTPSAEGASALFDRAGFYARSPADHFTIWEPSRIKPLLKAYGFIIEKIRVTGHHPERLPLLRSLAARRAAKGKRPSLPRYLAAAGTAISRSFDLGDTFEVYAVREGGPRSSLAGAESSDRASVVVGRAAATDTGSSRGGKGNEIR
ncbi:MAG: methyltransferase domain-containing protein, partial [Spirochaetaceae bacterium]|nr:methyltransferase domain-containing protein [Spirochaetaceae bacterium]